MDKKISDLVVGDLVIAFGNGMSRYTITTATVTKVYKKYIVATTEQGYTYEINHSGRRRGETSSFTSIYFEPLSKKNEFRATRIRKIMMFKRRVTSIADVAKELDTLCEGLDTLSDESLNLAERLVAQMSILKGHLQNGEKEKVSSSDNED